MSNDIQKADQIAFHFYTKLFYAVNEARATEGVKAQPKVDKWVRESLYLLRSTTIEQFDGQFNIETPDSDLFSREAREPYRNISQAPSPGPFPFEIQVVLSVPELANNQVLVYSAPDSPRVRIEPSPKYIVLENWALECTPHRAGFSDQFASNPDIALPIIYKHGIVLFRSVFSMLRILPAWKFYKRLRRKVAGVNRNGNLGIQLRIRPLTEDVNESRILEFSKFPPISLLGQSMSLQAVGPIKIRTLIPHPCQICHHHHITNSLSRHLHTPFHPFHIFWVFSLYQQPIWTIQTFAWMTSNHCCHLGSFRSIAKSSCRP